MEAYSVNSSIEAIRERLEAVPYGFAHEHCAECGLFGANKLAELDADGKWKLWDQNVFLSTKACEFIANAPQDMRALLALVSALTRERDAAREALKRL